MMTRKMMTRAREGEAEQAAMMHRSLTQQSHLMPSLNWICRLCLQPPFFLSSSLMHSFAFPSLVVCPRIRKLHALPCITGASLPVLSEENSIAEASIESYFGYRDFVNFFRLKMRLLLSIFLPALVIFLKQARILV